MVESVKKNLIEAKVCSGDCLLVAVSGGVDSMVLLQVLHTLSEAFGYSLIVCHLDHMYRGDDAIRDMHVVKSYCKSIKVPFHGYRRPIEHMAKTYTMGFEEMARKVRYDLFHTLAHIYHCRYIVTAHHRDDQVETILHHLMRGTGLNGLCGIKSIDGKRMRPMIDISKSDIYHYAQTLGIDHGEDHTNQSADFTRNKIRLELLPYLESAFNPAIKNVLLQLSRLVSDEVDFLNLDTKRLFNNVIFKKGACCYIDINKYMPLCIAQRRRLIRALYADLGSVHSLSFKHVDIIDSWIIEGQLRTMQHIRGIVFEKLQGQIVVHPKDSVDNIQIERPSVPLQMGVNNVKAYSKYIEVSSVRRKTKANEIEVIFKRVFFLNGLTLRVRADGDYIRLKGMNGHKKTLKKLYNDLKVPLEQRKTKALLAVRDEVLWIEGLRESEHQLKNHFDDDLIFIYISSLW